MSDLEHRDHETDAAGVAVKLIWLGDYWDVYHADQRIGTLAESYPVIGGTATFYVAKLAGQENVADGFESTVPETALAGLVGATI